MKCFKCLRNLIFPGAAAVLALTLSSGTASASIWDAWGSPGENEAQPAPATQGTGGWTVWEEPEETEEEDHIQFSGDIDSWNGIIYVSTLTQEESVINYALQGTGRVLRELNIQPVVGNYACSFTFYKNRLIYACKEGGSSDYMTAICEADPDGGNPKVIAQGMDKYTRFYIQDGCVVYDFWEKDQNGVLVGTAYDLENGTYSQVRSIANDQGSDYPQVEYYWDGYLYFQEGNDLYRHPNGTGIETAQPWYSLNDYSKWYLHGLEDGAMFISVYEGGLGRLVMVDLETNQKTEICNHQAAGGGDPYFGW